MSFSTTSPVSKISNSDESTVVRPVTPKMTTPRQNALSKSQSRDPDSFRRNRVNSSIISSPSYTIGRTPKLRSVPSSPFETHNHKKSVSIASYPTSSGSSSTITALSTPLGTPSPSSQQLRSLEGNNIKVIARFRPPNESELQNRLHSNISTFDKEQTSVTINNNDVFTFDRVFDPKSTQKQVFDYSIVQTVDDFFNGYNGTVLAYGQTGSGKTYTMMGSSIEDESNKGLIPRITDFIFDKISNSSNPDVEYTLSASYMEIYMEQIRDLLVNSNSSKPLQIHEDLNNGIYVENLSKYYIASSDELYRLLIRGSESRAKASTEMNEESSRSHAIFQLNLTQQNNVTNDGIKKSKLFLVDLAGSEKIGKTGVTGQALEEAKKINRSLSALGNVINALTDFKSLHIPYRDSKLTRILQESLGGNARTSLIVNCSPSNYNLAETISTLRFGTRAKKIKNEAHINVEPSQQDLMKRLEQMERLNKEQLLHTQELELDLKLWKERAEQAELESCKSNQNPGETKNLPDQEVVINQLTSRVFDLTTILSYTPIFSENIQDENIPILAKFRESQMINKLLLENIESKCNELIESESIKVELESKLKKYSNTVEQEKLFALETTLDQFSIRLAELENQNNHLLKDLSTTKKISEVRNERIKTLESMVNDQSASANPSTSNTPLSTIDINKKRIHSNNSNYFSFFSSSSSLPSVKKSTKLSNTQPLPNLSSNNKNNSFHVSDGLPSPNNGIFKNDENVDNGNNYSLTRKFSTSSTATKSSHSSMNSFQNPRIGLNLQIIKPIRSGSTLVYES